MAAIGMHCAQYSHNHCITNHSILCTQCTITGRSIWQSYLFPAAELYWAQHHAAALPSWAACASGTDWDHCTAARRLRPLSASLFLA